MLFSFAPLIVFVLMIAGSLLGEESARKAAADWLDSFLARSEARSLIDMVRPEQFEKRSWVFATISGITLAWASTLIFVRLRISVNRLLGFRSSSMKQAVRHSLIGRAMAFLFTLISGIIFVAGILLTAMAPRIIPMVFPALTNWAGIGVNVINAGVLFLAVGAIMRFLAVNPPSWRGILYGSLFVLVAFELGRVLVNLYLANSEIASAYGAASSLVVFLLWIYYSAQMLLCGVAVAGVVDGGEED